MMNRSRTLLTVGAALACLAVVAGCGGGSQTPTVGSAAAGSGGLAPTTKQPPNTAAVTVTIKIPAKKASTSKRAPAFVSPGTSYINVTALPGNVSTGNVSCSYPSCTATIFAPLDTTSLSVQLLDASYNVLSQTTQAVTITPGQANNFNFTFDGIAVGFSIVPAASQVVIGVPATFAVVVSAVDAAGNPVVPPGNIVDGSGNVVSNGSTSTFSLASGFANLTLSGGTWNPANYTYTMTASYDGTDPGTNPDQIALTASSSASTITKTVQLPVVPKELQVFATGTSDYQVAYAVPTPGATPEVDTSIEFGMPPPSPAAVNLQVQANFNPGAATLALTSDSCTGTNIVDGSLANAFSTPPTYVSGLALTVNVSAYQGLGCSFTITDATNNIEAVTTFFFNSATVNVYGKGRK